ncbi:MAG: metallophosphoesterase family protein [bacterium]
MAAIATAAIVLDGCGHTGRLQSVTRTVSPAPADSSAPSDSAAMTVSPMLSIRPTSTQAARLTSLFGTEMVAFVPGTADSTRRFLGRLSNGYTADTLNIFLCGDNRPGHRTNRLQPQYHKIKDMVSLNPLKFGRGLLAIPVFLAKGLYPDFALIRDIPDLMRNTPRFGREQAVVDAMIATIDSVHAHGQIVSAVVNTGDLVKDGRYPGQWERFLEIVRPLASRVPYFPIAGNHERTDTIDGIENWLTGTGLPIGGQRLYYCFDSADGWVRFIALDSNPMTDPANHWTREVEIEYSDEQIEWLVARLSEHTGPAFVFLHHPPFSSGFHRVEWEDDPMLVERRERIVRAMRDAGIAVLASGHEHAYQRALLTWPDAVLISIVTGGAGSPLHAIPSPAQSARLYSEYKVAGSVVNPENVLTESVFHFVHVRLWFGGGEFFAYAVDADANRRLIDKVEIDLKRYGVPEIDQLKMPIRPQEGPAQLAPKEETTEKEEVKASSDSTSASERLESQPPPSEPDPLPNPDR